jgi:ABC-type multidrug transport system fused ATPase/permease subunit
LPMSGRQRETQKLVAIEKRSAQFLIVLLLASLWFQSWSISLGLILGGGVAILNFRWLWRIVEKVLFEQNKFYGIQALVKFIFLVFVVFLIFRYLAVNPIAFIVGVSTLVAGILFEAFRESLPAERKGNT